LTGESLPVTRHAGDALLSGSLNGGVAILIRATPRVEDSQYQRIVALVEEAGRSRAPLVRLADRYAVPFAIVSLLIAGIAWWVSGDPVRFAEVLVLATPCPLLIAAPVAFLREMSRAASDVAIVKGGGTLEQLARIRTVAFDKTGTLTYGQPASVEPVELHSGHLAIYVSVAGKFAGTIVMSDQVRGNAAATLARLRNLGVGESMILTGDAQATADHVAAESASPTCVPNGCLSRK
jgi:cation transport ATPase